MAWWSFTLNSRKAPRAAQRGWRDEVSKLVEAIGFGDDGFVSYTPEGCYSGSNGVESRLSVSSGSRFEPMSLEARKAMQELAGFTSLLAR